MEASTHFWDIGYAFWIMISGLAVIKCILDIAANWNKEDEIFKVRSHAAHDSVFEDEMYHHGYIFCTVFKTSDIHAIAHGIGIALTKEDVVKIVSAIKKDFTIRVGIDQHRIEMYIRIIIKRNLEKQ